MKNKIPSTPFSTALSGSAKETERRLKNIFSGQKKRPPVLLLCLTFAACLLCGNMVSFHAQAVAADSPALSISGETGLGLSALIDRFKVLFASLQTNTTPNTAVSSEAERYYKADSLPLFQIAFSRLTAEEQNTWLERLYEDGDFAFFSVAVDVLGGDSPLPAAFAKTAYEDGEIAFFSILTDRMDGTELESWLDRTLEDGDWGFQSMLFDKLDRDDEFNEWKDKNEKEWEEAQMAEYRAAGITIDGKNYYYQGQLVNIFLDIRPNKSFYTLDMNPSGTVNVKILRGSDGQVTGAAYMTEAEVTELLDDMRDD